MKHKNAKIIVLVLVIIGVILVTSTMLIELFGNKNKRYYNENLYTDTLKYEIKKDDTLEKIAVKFNIFENKLLEMNSISEEDIKPGKIIDIPNVTHCKVEKGDTLDLISYEFNVSKNVLKKANNLKDNDISKLKEILIPNTLVYTAFKETKISEIAKETGYSAKEIQKYNVLKNDYIKENEYVLIPKKVGMDESKGLPVTREEEESMKYLTAFAQSLYESGEYKKYTKPNNEIYLVIDEAKLLNVNVPDYIIRCINSTPVVTYNTKVDTNKYYPFVIRYKCDQEGK